MDVEQLKRLRELEGGLRDPDTHRRQTTVLRIGAFGNCQEVLEILRTVLANRSEDKIVRANAAKMLGVHRDGNSVPYLMVVLQEDSYFLQLEAVVALGKIKSDMALTSLRNVMSNTSSDNIRAACKRSISHIASTSNIPA